MELRPYQTDAIEKIRACIRNGKRRILLVSPTGCLTGDSVIGINRAGKGISIRLDRLVFMMNGGVLKNSKKWDHEIKTKARAKLDSGKIGLVEVIAAYESGEKEVYEISVESGAKVKATLDHKFLSDNGWKPLRDISVDNFLYVEESNRPLRKKTRKRKPQYLVTVAKLHPHATRKKVGRGSGYTVPKHRLVFEASLNRMPFEEFLYRVNSDITGLVFLDHILHVHHLDGDSKNNDLSNLVACTPQEHNKFHEADAIESISCRATTSRVVSIKKIGIEKTFDLSMAGPNNFIANGLVVHNSGKTCIAADIINSATIKSSNVLFIAHRREIIYQTQEKLNALGIEHAVIMSGHPKSALATVHLASIQTLRRRDAPDADLVVIDESHHVGAKSYQDIVEKYPNAIILGLTATPCRGDGKGLGSTFDEIVQVIQVNELIARNYLVPCVAYAPSIPDLKGVKIKRGDYAEDQLAEAVDKPKLIGDIVEHWHKLARDRQTVVFCASVAHSNHLTEAFRASGVIAEHLDGETPDERRAEILSDLSKGNIQLVCNVGVLTEGWNCPVVSCVVLARPTKSYGLFLQMAGRGLRTAEGKQDLLLIDHAGAIHEHGLIDQEIKWTLEKTELAWEKKLYEKRTAAPWTCQNCFHVNQPAKTNTCEACGVRPVGMKQIAVGKGMLERITKTKEKTIPVSIEDKEKFWKDCFWRCVKRGLKVGAAAHMYRQRVGTWPRGFDLLPREKHHWQMPADQYYNEVVKGKSYGSV